MSPERWERMLALHERAIELQPEERASFLARECHDDLKLAADIERLLTAKVEGEFPRLQFPDAATQIARGFAGRELGDFLLVEEIGRGGMGVVYLANQRSLHRFVALKLLPSAKHDERSVKRFEREAAAAAGLEHSRIVPVYASHFEADLAWYVMRYVPGWDLAEELKRQSERRTGKSQQQIAWPPFEGADYIAHAVEKVAELAEAIAYAHEKGVVHRDVKPNNILLDPQGTPFLTDFGLARDDRFGTLTSAGAIQGTPHYMSPEQVEAQRKAVDHRTDVYSLGVVLYQILSLRRPFEGRTSQEVFQSIATREAPALVRANPRVPRDLATIVEKAMAKKREWRYSTSAELGQDLRRFLRHESIAARPPSRFERSRRFVLRHRISFCIAALSLLVASASVWTTRYAKDRVSVDKAISVIREGIRAGTWEPGQAETVRNVKAQVLRMDELRSALTSAERSEVDAAKGQLEATLEGWLVLAAEQVDRGLRPDRSQNVFDTDDLSLLHGVTTFAEALRTFPEDSRALKAIGSERYTCEVQIRAEDSNGLPLSGNAAYRTIAPFTSLASDRVELGALPAKVQLPPGAYRFIVSPSDSESYELFRLIWREEPLLEVVYRSSDGTAGSAAMVRIPGGILTIPPAELQCPYAGQALEIPAFELDLHPVSVGRFKEFLRASGHSVPFLWTQGLETAPDGVPATGMSWDDARACAEWMGKRLVTAPEFELATRGEDGAEFPYPTPTEGDRWKGATGGDFIFGLGLQDEIQRFFASVSLVESNPEACSVPHGLFHPLGNVMQMTETLGASRVKSGFVVRPSDRIVLGAPWYARAHRMTLATRRIWGADESYAALEHGFRCARSVIP